MKVTVFVVGLMVALGLSAPLWAQSLAEVARKEEARRKAIKTPSKVYTNATIQPEPVGSPPSGAGSGSQATAQPGEPSSGAAVSPSSSGAAASQPSASAPVEPVKDQAYWSKRMAEARAGLERSRVLQAAVQSRTSALTSDFVARDDPAQRALIAADRQRALDELARLDEEIAQQTKAIADLEEEARRAGVPPGWLR